MDETEPDTRGFTSLYVVAQVISIQGINQP